ncbi:MAG: M20/M25/M40 family metallo-hydrolase [Anaerolineales bacterium]|nr:M20/M25/M40 family metallo-hydrolase [Anaerolineales bacterium]
MQPSESIQDYLQKELSNYIELLRQMVEINSFTANAQGVNQLANLSAKIFAPFGFQAEYVQSANPNFGKHLFLRRAPQAHGGEIARKEIALISHLDTVFPPEEEQQNDFHWRPEGDRIYGPGTVDIKGGTVMIYMALDALCAFFPTVFDSVNWLICLDASEEVLSEDFGKQCLARLSENTLGCLVFEGGSISAGEMPLVVARKGRATYQVQVEGKSAHAGNAHALGANAIVQIAHTIQQIASFTDYEKNITFNVGTITGGSVVNRVPHHAQAEVEMRAFDPDIFQAGIEKMLALNGKSQIVSNEGYPCKVSIQIVDRTGPWPRNPGTERLYRLWAEVAAQVGIRVSTEERGGLSDGNMLWRRFPTLDGLGPAGSNAHCSERSADGSKEQEYVQISSFAPKALLNTLAIAEMIHRG